jgi:hypothetical protein
MSTINVSATRLDGLDISSAIHTIRYIASKAGIDLQQTEHRLRGHGPRVDLEQIGAVMLLHGFSCDIVDDDIQDPRAPWTATIEIDATSCPADSSADARLRLAERLAAADDIDEPGSGDEMHRWYVQCTLAFLRARCEHAQTQGARVRRIEVSGRSADLDPKRALLAAMAPFGSLHPVYGVDPEVVADLMLAWAGDATPETSTALLSAVRAAAFHADGACCAVSFGTGRVSLVTPTSGTEIRVQCLTRGHAITVDFGEHGSSSRAEEIVKHDATLAWHLTLVNGTVIEISPPLYTADVMGAGD